jgi:hypothetical protein
MLLLAGIMIALVHGTAGQTIVSAPPPKASFSLMCQGILNNRMLMCSLVLCAGRKLRYMLGYHQQQRAYGPRRLLLQKFVSDCVFLRTCS